LFLYSIYSIGTTFPVRIFLFFSYAECPCIRGEYYWFTTLSSIFVIPFIRLFLKTNVYIPKYEKYLYLFVLFYILALGLNIGICRIELLNDDLNGLILAVSFFAIGIIAARKGYRSAYFFLLGLELFAFWPDHVYFT
jgi:hypothetical protein